METGCKRTCICSSCRKHITEQTDCGECFEDSLEQCRAGGIKKCKQYRKDTVLGRIWDAIRRKIDWKQVF